MAPLVFLGVKRLVLQYGPSVLRFAIKWSPYYIAKYSLLYSIKKHGIPKLYRGMLKYNYKITPKAHRSMIQKSLKICAKSPQSIMNNIGVLDEFLFNVIKEEGKNPRGDIPEEFLSNLEYYLSKSKSSYKKSDAA